jgi:hypothetical protein
MPLNQFNRLFGANAQALSATAAFFGSIDKGNSFPSNNSGRQGFMAAKMHATATVTAFLIYDMGD